jgi:hypothetical protein
LCNNKLNDYAHAYVEVIIVNRKKFTTALIAAMTIGALCLGVAACGGKQPEPTETETETTEITTTTTTTAPTTTLTVWSGPMATTEEVTWKETKLEAPATYYVKVNKGEFLNVRSGPGTTYEKVGALTRGQSVTVVAKANGIWYKTQDGYFISDTYLSGKIPN